MNSEDKSKIIFKGGAWVRETVKPAPNAVRPLPAPGYRRQTSVRPRNGSRPIAR